MSQTSSQTRLDWKLYIENRNKWTFEQMEPYLGYWVAWSLDGTQIVAHDKDLGVVIRTAELLGKSSEEVLLDYLPGGDEPDTIL